MQKGLYSGIRFIKDTMFQVIRARLEKGPVEGYEAEAQVRFVAVETVSGKLNFNDAVYHRPRWDFAFGVSIQVSETQISCSFLCKLLV